MKSKLNIFKQVLLAAVLVLILSCAVPSAALAADDYPYKSSEENQVDRWNYFTKQCTSFVAWCLDSRNGIAFHNWYGGVNFGNAKTWIAAAQSIGVTVNSTPAKGAVACWTSGKYGHVAWVSQVNGNGTVTIEEYNNVPYAYSTRTVSTSSPAGYIHFKDLSTSSGTVLANGVYRLITAVDQTKCLDVAGGSTNSGTNVQIWTSGPTKAQIFRVVNLGNGYYNIININGGCYLDVAYSGTANGTNVQVVSPNGAAAQQWAIQDAGGGWYTVVSRCSGLCLDVNGAGSANGTNVHTWTKNGDFPPYGSPGPAQRWKFVKACDGNHTWNNGTVTKEPTCAAEGSRVLMCTDCGEQKTETIPKTTAHRWDSGRITKQPSCTGTGIKAFTCSCCGEARTETVAATGHHYGAWITVAAATVNAPARQEARCACGAVQTRSFGTALTPTAKPNVSTVRLQIGKSTSGLSVTELTAGDYVTSWESSNTDILKINRTSGKVTAQKKTGTVFVTATLASGQTVRFKVYVQKSAVRTTKITGLPKTLHLKAGQKKKLKPVLQPFTSSEKVSFRSSNKKTAVVSSRGVITAKSGGTTKITVKSGRKQFTVKLIVQPKASTVKNTYTRYMKKLSSYRDSSYYLTDLNNDGIKELIYRYQNGTWSGVRVCTYKNQKVVLIRSWPQGVSRVSLRKRSRTLVLCTGTINTEYTYRQYRFTGSRLKQTGDVYQMLVNHDTSPWSIRYNKNKQTISESAYNQYIKNELTDISFKSN